MVNKRGHYKRPLVHTKAKPGPAVRNEINVAPLVDICLVLLIIFMVVTPELTRGMEVNLPQANNANEQKDTGALLIVSVTKEGSRATTYVAQDRVGDGEGLKDRLEKELRSQPDKRIFFKADEDLQFGQVYPMLIVLQEVGMSDVAMGVEEPKE